MEWIWLLAASAALAQPSSNAQPPPRDALAKALEQQRASVARQREPIRKQAENLGVWLPPAAAETPPAVESPVAADTPQAISPPPAEPSCDALSDAVVMPLIESAAKAQELESSFRPCAVSSKGAKGLMQLMPDTAQDLGVHDPFDPRQSIEAGARYFRQLMTRYHGDLQRALGAYNAGPTTVDQAGGVPDIVETREYVEAVLRKVEAAKSGSK